MASVAYEMAGYKPSYANASTLKKVSKVKDRIETLKQEALSAAELDKDKLLGQFMKVYEMAVKKDNLNVASATLERLAKAAGLWTERTETTQRAQTREQTVEQLEQLDIQDPVVKALVDALKRPGDVHKEGEKTQ
jgi:hypothetical protein